MFSPSYKRENNCNGSEQCLRLIFAKLAEYVEISRSLKTRLRPQQPATGHLAALHPRSRSVSDLSITGQSCQQLAVIVNQAEAWKLFPFRNNNHSSFSRFVKIFSLQLISSKVIIETIGWICAHDLCRYLTYACFHYVVKCWM